MFSKATRGKCMSCGREQEEEEASFVNRGRTATKETRR